MTLISKAFLLAGAVMITRASHQAMQQVKPSMPAVLLDLFVAFLLCLTGALVGTGSFRPTHLSQDPSHRCKDILDSRPDFAVFNHRGPLLRSRQL